MGGKENSSSSLMLNTTPSPSGSHVTRIPPDQQPSVIPIELYFPQKYKNHSDEVFMPPNDAITTCSLTPVYTNDERDSGDLKENVKVEGMDEQVTGETKVAAEGDKVTTAQYAHPHPTQLTSIQAEVTGEPTMVPSRTSSPSTVLQSTSTVPCISSLTPCFHRGSTTPSTCSFTQAIPSTCSSQSMALQSTSTAPYIPTSATIMLPSSILHLCSFSNVNSWPSTCPFSKGQCSQHSVSSTPSNSITTTQKPSSKSQPQCSVSSPSRHFIANVDNQLHTLSLSTTQQ